MMRMSFNQAQSYNDPMSIRSTKTKNADDEDVFLIEFSGPQLKNLELLKERVDASELQDVVRIALNLLVKVSRQSKRNNDNDW